MRKKLSLREAAGPEKRRTRGRKELYIIFKKWGKKKVVDGGGGLVKLERKLSGEESSKAAAAAERRKKRMRRKRVGEREEVDISSRLPGPTRHVPYHTRLYGIAVVVVVVVLAVTYVLSHVFVYDASV